MLPDRLENNGLDVIKNADLPSLDRGFVVTHTIDFDVSVDRRATDSIKWQKYAHGDIIPMWVADMDFMSPPSVIQALHKRIEHGVFGYAEPKPTLVQTVVQYLKRTYNWSIEPDWLVWLPGLVSGLNICCRSVAKPGSAVLTTLPVYPPFLSAPRLAQRILQTTTMVFDRNRWCIDFNNLQNQKDNRTKLFLLCNPHNPTGRMFEERELLQLAEICLHNGWIICSDEIHCDLILEPGRHHLPLASLDPGISARTITLMAPSKTYNIPGLGCAYAVISDDELRRRFKQAMAGIVPHTNLMGLAAAQAAYAHGQSWLKQLLVYLRGNRNMVRQRIQALPGLSMGPIEATYLAWIDARDMGVEDPTAFFEAAGVGLSNGTDFGAPGYVRLNFGCTRDLLKKALDRMAKALDKMKMT